MQPIPPLPCDPPPPGDPPALAQPSKPKLKRGRRADPLKAPRGFMRRLVNELADEAQARQEARKAEPDYRLPSMSSSRGARLTNAEVFARMKLSKAQRVHIRTKELKAQREEKARRDATLIAFVHEQRARRAELEKAAAERKANGIKLTYDQWKRAALGGNPSD